jgi:hypothetical protein
MHAVPRDLLASSSLSEADTAAVVLLANLASDCFAAPFFLLLSSTCLPLCSVA